MSTVPWIGDRVSRMGWAPQDLRDVTAHNRPLWDAVKRENGWGGTKGRDIPGFFECLQEMYDGGYSFTDIGAVFGLTRERIRQLFRREASLRDGDSGSLVRIWSDERECFVPISRTEETRIWRGHRDAQRVEHKKQTRLARKQRHAERRALHVATIHDLTTRNGRVPGINELATMLGTAPPGLALYWGRNPPRPRISYVAAFDNMYAAAGVERPEYSGPERHDTSARASALKEWRERRWATPTTATAKATKTVRAWDLIE